MSKAIARLLFHAGFATLVTASTSAFAAAQRTFVASTGSDTNSCTLVAPCRSFQSAINAVAAGGEVVALDSAGYGAMEIHKSVSVIVPPGIHAGLSPATGIPLPGFPGQSTVVFIDIQSTDTVVLRGLSVNHQGTVTGGIDWLSANGGTVHVENTIISGFPNEGLFMSAPYGRMFVKDSIFRGNHYGIYVRSNVEVSTLSADRVRIEDSHQGFTNEGWSKAIISNSVITANGIGIYQTNVYAPASVSEGDLTISHCVISNNTEAFKIESAANHLSTISVAASTINYNIVSIEKLGPNSSIFSLGNNSAPTIANFDFTFPPR